MKGRQPDQGYERKTTRFRV